MVEEMWGAIFWWPISPFRADMRRTSASIEGNLGSGSQAAVRLAESWRSVTAQMS
jgi:hypothetical protein